LTVANRACRAGDYDESARCSAGVDVRIAGFDWKAAQIKGREILAPDEQRIVDLLAQGKSTYKIARILGINRSAIWFKAASIREKLDPDAGK
jgi:DNA-binding NarL/FixJ family response regulator